MGGRNNADKERRWRDMLKRQADSGLSIRRFCAREGVSEPSFYAWRRKLGDQRIGGETGPGRPRKEAADAGSLFVPLSLVDVSSLEIIHPLGCRIRVKGDVNSATLRQVIEALDSGAVR